MKVNKEIVDQINNIYWGYTVGPQEIKSPKDLAVLTSMCAFGYNVIRGPITVTRGRFKNVKENKSEEVTLITLGGTQFRDGQATRFLESKLSMKGKDNDYLTALVKLFDTKNESGFDIIPKDKPLIISGISLGGMIAQQLLSVDRIVNNYNIKSIITFGSPCTKPLDRRNIRVRRFVEKGDIVPKLGLLQFKVSRKKSKLMKELDSIEMIREDGKYKTKLESHALSYVQHSNWDKYDFYGDEAGNNVLELLDDMKFYDAPVISK